MICEHCKGAVARDERGFITVKGREWLVHMRCALWISAHRDRLDK